MTDSFRVSSAVDWIKKFIPSGVRPKAKEAEKVVVGGGGGQGGGPAAAAAAAQGAMAVGGGLTAAAAAGKLFVRAAGISGILAVGLGAYGAHVLRPGTKQEHLKLAFETGNRYHFFHTLALLGVPLTRRPNLFGGLLCLGMLLFCGSCYCYALTENESVRKVTPYGGMLLIAAWASIII